jgi:hypothetical protein
MTKNLRAAFAMALLAIGCMLTNATAHAQSVYGSIFGTVTDRTGAVVPGATVTVTDEAKGTVETVISNGSGDYNVSHLVPDTYDLKVEIKGFKSFLSKGINVLADVAPRVDVSLEVSGAGAETVEVNADSVPQLKTDRADVSTVFDQQQVSDLPVGDQNFTNLQLLLPGAQLLGWSHAADENPQGSKQIQIDGQAFGGTAFELDGTDNQDPILGIIVVNPALDAVTETKITTQNFDAELGKAVSAVVTAQTRSGSNSFHGSAYDFRTGNANLARDPYTQSPAAGTSSTTGLIPAGLKNRYGGSIGGPVLKNRLFFFGNYEAQRQKVGTGASDTVPTQHLISTCLSGNGCDFSEYATSLVNGGQLIYHQGFDAKGNPISIPYANNVIPSTDLSPQALALLKILQPFTPTNAGVQSNFTESGTGLFNSDAWTTRIDGTISQKANAFVRFSRFTDTLSGKVAFGEAGGPGFGLSGYGGNSTGANDSLAVGTDYVFSPTLVSDLRLGYYRYNVIDSKYTAGNSLVSDLGLPGVDLGGAAADGAPGFEMALIGTGNPVLIGGGLGINRCNCPLIEREDQFQIVNNWTKTWGNHAFKVGADLRYGRNLRVPSDTDRAGQFNFYSNPTSDQGTNGLGIASFLLGDVSSFGRYVSTSTNAKEFQKRTFFYAQDTWRATSKLTLNLGVRWELYFPETVNGKGNGSLLNLQTGYLQVAGYGNIGSNMNWSIDKARQFQPRLGIAYQLNPKTVVRAGYGRSFDTGVFGSIFGHTVTQNLPVLANQQITATGGNTSQSFCLGSPTTNAGCNVAYNASGQPATGGPLPYAFPTIPANGLLPVVASGISVNSRPNPLRFPTLDAWNLSFQRALTPTTALTIAYVGNKGTHTLGDGDNNGTNPNEGALVLPGSFSVNGQTLHYDPSVKGSNIAPDGGVSNTLLLQRYLGGKLASCSDPLYVQPKFQGINLPAGACGWSGGINNRSDDLNTTYEAMQVTLAKQFAKGFAATANYQWASAFSENAGYSTWSKSAVHGRDTNVRDQSLVAYGSYELPFGKGKMLMPNANKALDLLIGGYQLSSTVNWSGGLPFSVSYSNFNPNDPTHPETCTQNVGGAAPCQPNEHGHMVTGLTSFDVNTHHRNFFKAQPTTGGVFSFPGLDVIGNAGRNTYMGPHYFNADMSLSKDFPIWEKVAIKFRMDAYNAFNHINAGNPGNTDIFGSGSDGKGVVGSNAGTISGEAPGVGPRQLEFALRLQF